MTTKIKKIGHASISENNSKYGNAGDSTLKEVCTVGNYNISRIQPYIVLHPNTEELAIKSALACKAGCSNNNIGYSQSTRNTLYNLAKANGYDLSTVGLCNTDCSAFMTVCAIAGGANITYGSNGPTTSTMKAKFEQSGDYTVYTSEKYTSQSDSLKRGDILVKEGYHTIMVLENGDEIPGIPEIPELPDVEDEDTYEPVKQTITPISTTEISQQFDYSEASAQKVYVRVNNEYKQAEVYLAGSPAVVHLTK
jgi:hypothetical protein